VGALLGLAGLASVPLAMGDFYPSHDLLFWPYRLWELDRCLHDGQIFARWFPDFGWGRGMPFLNFYAPLFLYLAEGLHLAGLTLLGALKVAIFFVLAGSALGMYFLARQDFRREAAVLAGAAYLFGPYFLTVVYLRGGLAEALGFVWMPLCLLAVRKAVTQGGRAAVLLGAVCLAGTITTHNITAMLVLPIALAYGLAMGWGQRGCGRRLAICFGVGLGLSAFFWFPALVERRFVRMEDILADRYQYQRNFASLANLWDMTGERLHPLTSDGVHLTLGGPQILLALLSLGMLGPAGVRRRSVVFSWALFVIGFLMILPLSKPLWAAVPTLKYVQFPWRWMGICSLSLAYLGAAGLEAVLEERGKFPRVRLLAAGGGLILLLPSLVALWPPAATSATTLPLAALIVALGTALYLANRPGSSFHWSAKGVASLFCLGVLALFLLGQGERGPFPMEVSPRELTLAGWLNWERKSGFVGTTIKGEYLPRSAPREAPTEPPPAQFLRAESPDGAAIQEVRRWSTGLEAKVSVRGNRRLIYERFYFPGWFAWVDGRRVPVKASAEGLVSFPVTSGTHKVEVRFGLTRVRLGATLASYLSLLLMALLALTGHRKR